jgi:predicted N-acetyltransferase YhbS
MTLQTSSGASAPALQLEQPQDAAAIEGLLDRAFGPGRFTKVSERVREIAAFAPEYSFCAWEGDRLVGSVRMWKVAVGGQPLVFLGPLAVDDDQRRAGVGGLLVERASQAAKAAGETAVLLVGDLAYFTRSGFDDAPARAIVLPGPVDQRRVLLRQLTPTAPFEGPLTGR